MVVGRLSGEVLATVVMMMPLKQPEVDWTKFLEYSLEQQNIQEFQERLSSMDGRELYDMSTISLVNRYLIDRPVNYAFHRARLNYNVEPIEVMKSAMIDGSVFLKIGDADHIGIDEYVSRGEWDPFTDKLTFVEVKYLFSEGRKDMWHIEHFYRGPDDTCRWVLYSPSESDDESRWSVAMTLELPFFPYVGIRWINGTSFLFPLKSAIIRLETAYRVIGAENVERMGLSLYIEGVKDINDIKTAPRKMGRRVHILPPNSQFHSPNPDAPGMQLMVQEIENLHIAIEKASGVVSTERLSTLSGVSRAIAEKPLIILADELRNRFTDGMVQAIELAKTIGPAPDFEVSYRPLRYVENKTEYLTILDRAREAGAIDDEEYALELRLLLDLDGPPPTRG